jgi:formylglycine-generating enzyme required for sulfatase activity
MIDRQDQKPQLIFLASCQSASRDSADAFRGFAPKLIAVGVPTVLAMQDFVPVETAEEFTRTFYRQLFQHGQVDLASNQARSALLTGEFPGSSIPVLFSRLPDNQLLAQLTGDAAPVIETKHFEPETIYIPAGPFLMGSQEGEEVPAYETPQHEVDLPAYRIGKYPVTNEQYAEFIRQTGRLVAPEAGWKGNIPPDGTLDHPVAGVTWNEAIAYCLWLRGQTGREYCLPSEAQWEKAARGTDGRIYPWGDEWQDGCCNHGSDHTTPVDAYPKGVSPYGCYDMVGNVREWVNTRWGEDEDEPDDAYRYPWNDDDRENLAKDDFILRVYRGGAAKDDRTRQRCSARGGFKPDRPGPPHRRHGFRVAVKLLKKKGDGL